MANLLLQPQFGTLSDSKHVSYNIEGLPALEEGSTYSFKFENTTFPSPIKIINEEERIIDLNIPPIASQSAISIFASIYVVDSYGNSRLIKICPSIFYIQNEITKFDGDISVSPFFASPKDVCCIKISSKPNKKVIFSVNDKRLPVVTNESGSGSIHFSGYDVLTGDIYSVQRFPIAFYSDEDNYTKKKFSGAYINILPQEIAAHADLDPRCDPSPGNDAYVAPGAWVAPPECSEVEPPGTVSPIEPGVPPVDIPSSCEDEVRVPTDFDKCRINTDSIALLNNGMVLHAYTGVDSSIFDPTSEYYNINKIHVAKSKTSLDSAVITTRDVAIAPKSATADFEIYVKEDLYSSLSDLGNTSASDVYVLLNDRSIGNQSVQITGKRINEYTGEYILDADVGNTYANIETWLFGVRAVFYHKSEEPERYLDNLPSTLSYVRDSDDNVLQVLNVSIASNYQYVSENEESYVYLIAEAIINNTSQLFFYSFSIGKDDSYIVQSYGWEQLTSTGNNINAKTYIDTTNTLHVIWESDRAGSWQIYYGVLGSSYLSIANAAFSSSVDKQADLLEQDNLSSTYLSSRLIQIASGDEYNPIPEYGTQDLIVNQAWNKEQQNGGLVRESSSGGYLTNLMISSSVLNDMAMAFTAIPIGDPEKNPSANDNLSCSQINYQISFTMAMDLSQPSSILNNWNQNYLSIEEIDTYYDVWKAGFTLEIDSNRSNVPTYTKADNSFILGRQDNVFDRMVPFFGVYEISSSNPSAQSFQINITKDENNLKDFMFGLMLEKSRFKATNCLTEAEYTAATGSADGYISEEEHILYTGRARLVAFIKTEDTNDERANYYIVREFPQVFDITSSKDYTIMANYTRIDSEEVVRMLDQYEGTYSNRYVGSVTLILDGDVKFSQSFISTLSYVDNYFDFGFGIPYGGYCISDKMTPHKIDVFEDISVNLTFEDISVSSPTYTYNSSIANLPDVVRNMVKYRIEDVEVENPSSSTVYDNSSSLLNLGFRGTEQIVFSDYENRTGGDNFKKTYDVSQIDLLTIEFSTGSNNSRIRVNSEYGTTLYNSGMISTATYDNDMITQDVDVTYSNAVTIRVEASSYLSSWDVTIFFKTSHADNNFLQVPITMEGINKSASICGGDCDDVHIAWQSNKSNYWDIYYSNAFDKLRPFRFNTQITNTKSNSISPSVSVSRKGSRMIVWHDNRNGDFDIYSARSLNGYSCDQNFIANRMVDAYQSSIVECSLSFDFEATQTGYHVFSINFYTETMLNDLFTTISMTDGVAGWYLNGSEMSGVASYSGNALLGVLLEKNQGVQISYIPSKEDGIFDRILYTTLVSTVT